MCVLYLHQCVLYKTKHMVFKSDYMNDGFPKQSCKKTLTPRNFLDFQQTIFLILRSTLCSCYTYIPDIFHWYTYPFCQGNIWFHQSLYGLVRCRSWNRQQYSSMHRACHELKVKYKLFFYLEISLCFVYLNPYSANLSFMAVLLNLPKYAW